VTLQEIGVRVILIFDLVDDVGPAAYSLPQEGEQAQEEDDSGYLTEGAHPGEEVGDPVLFVHIVAVGLSQSDCACHQGTHDAQAHGAQGNETHYFKDVHSRHPSGEGGDCPILRLCPCGDLLVRCQLIVPGHIRSVRGAFRFLVEGAPLPHSRVGAPCRPL